MFLKRKVIGLKTKMTQKIFFSRHGDFKFSINMDIFNEEFVPIKDERSIDDSLTVKGRAIYRGMKY